MGWPGKTESGRTRDKREPRRGKFHPGGVSGPWAYGSVGGWGASVHSDNAPACPCVPTIGGGDELMEQDMDKQQEARPTGSRLQDNVSCNDVRSISARKQATASRQLPKKKQCRRPQTSASARKYDKERCGPNNWLQQAAVCYFGAMPRSFAAMRSRRSFGIVGGPYSPTSPSIVSAG